MKKYKAKKPKELDFLSADDFKFIFGSALELIDDNEKTEKQQLRLILFMSYNYMFEQKHLFNLLWADVDLQNRLIKNVRSTSKGLSQDKFEMINEIYDLLISLNGRTKKNNNEYVFDYIRKDKNSINNLLGILNNRQKNYTRLSSKVNLQKIIRSRILLDLIKSEGKSLIDFYNIFGLTKDTQITTAIKEYLILDKSKMSNEF